MPGKNRPKRLNRNISWRVARRKKRIASLVSGGGRNRKPRPKKKVAEVKAVAEKKVATRNSVPSKLATKVASSSGKKVVKKTVKKVVKKSE